LRVGNPTEVEIPDKPVGGQNNYPGSCSILGTCIVPPCVRRVRVMIQDDFLFLRHGEMSSDEILQAGVKVGAIRCLQVVSAARAFDIKRCRSRIYHEPRHIPHIRKYLPPRRRRCATEFFRLDSLCGLIVTHGSYFVCCYCGLHVGV
jgi:hypothetical protein